MVQVLHLLLRQQTVATHSFNQVAPTSKLFASKVVVQVAVLVPLVRMAVAVVVVPVITEVLPPLPLLVVLLPLLLERRVALDLLVEAVMHITTAAFFLAVVVVVVVARARMY
jgi:hypothetical protein